MISNQLLHGLGHLQEQSGSNPNAYAIVLRRGALLGALRLGSAPERWRPRRLFSLPRPSRSPPERPASNQLANRPRRALPALGSNVYNTRQWSERWKTPSS